MVKGQYDPLGHFVQVICPPTEYVPGSHALLFMSFDMFGQAKPGGQSIQLTALAKLYVPSKENKLNNI